MGFALSLGVRRQRAMVWAVMSRGVALTQRGDDHPDPDQPLGAECLEAGKIALICGRVYSPYPIANHCRRVQAVPCSAWHTPPGKGKIMRGSTRVIVSGLAAVGLTAALATSAYAEDYEGGNQDCTSVHGRVVTRGDGTAGTQEHIHNGLSYVFPYKGYRHVDYSNRNQVSAGWYMGVSSSFYHSTTYAYCLY